MPGPRSGLFQLPSSRIQEPLCVIQSIEGAAFMQPCALTLILKPQKKNNVWPKVLNLGFLGPCGQNKVATLHFMTKSDYERNRAEGRNSGQAAPFPGLIRFQKRENACN